MTPPLAPSRARPTAGRWLNSRLLALGLLVAVADILLFTTEWGGVPVALMLAALVGAALAFNRGRCDPTRRRVAIVLGLAAAIALVEAGGPLAIAFGCGAAGAIVLLVAAPAMAWERLVLRVAQLPFVGWVRLPKDLGRAVRAMGRHGGERFDLRAWAMPIALSIVFVIIFAIANPVVEEMVQSLDPRRLIAAIGFFRLAFWMLAIVAIWPFLHLGRSTRPVPDGVAVRCGSVEAGGLLGAAAIVRSLVAFNVLFAIQTATDLGHLSGGLKLPDGMTLAEFAHRGAYPLMVAALVAAAFVLLALRDGMEDLDRRLRGLLIVFVVQGLLLVISSILRLELYVAAYSLTQWRLAAFAWMGLVAFGFATILVRIYARRSNRWLKNVVAGAFVVTLWGASMVDDVDIVARWNLSHPSAFAQTGTQLDDDRRWIDDDYLQSLGVRIAPALDAHRAALLAAVVTAPSGSARERDLRRRLEQLEDLRIWRRCALGHNLHKTREFRTWSFSGWRLGRYLSTMPEWPGPADP